MTAAQAKKFQAAQELQAAISRITELHRQTFAPMTRPTSPPAQRVDEAPLRVMLRKQNLEGVSLFARAARKEAKSQADQAASALAALQFSGRQRQHEEHDRELREWWAKLLANDPDVTEDLLNQAFDDNDAPAAVLSVVDDEVALVVLLPDISSVPERYPTTTPSGNLSLRKTTKAERESLYREVVCGTTLVTIREALAVAPGIARARIVAVRSISRSAFGSARVEALLAARFTRATLERVQWAAAEASTIISDASEELAVNYRGAAQTVAPLDLSQEPDLAQLVASIDVDDLS